MIKGIHHVAFKCETQEQYDEMICFYHELLELPILRKWDTGIHLDCFNSCIEIFLNGTKSVGKDVFVILRLRQIMWMNLLKKFVMLAIE